MPPQDANPTPSFGGFGLNQIIAIKPDFSGLAWRLGGPGGDFTFPDTSDRFYHQHSAKMLSNGNILLFDNGNGRPATEGGLYSRALELELDLPNMTARKAWEYRHSPDLYTACCSNATRLENGNSVLVFAIDLSVDACCRKFTIVESDANGDAVSVIENSHPGKVVQYRVYPISSINGESEVTPLLRIVDTPSGLRTTSVDFASTIVMDILADHVNNVSRLQFQVDFDSTVVSVSVWGVVQSAIAYDANNEAGYLRIVAASSTGFGVTNLPLAEIEFKAVGLAGRCTDLTFSEYEATDTSVPAKTIDLVTLGGTICLTNVKEIPFLDPYALVLIAVVLAVAAFWRRRLSNPYSGRTPPT